MLRHCSSSPCHRTTATTASAVPTTMNTKQASCSGRSGNFTTHRSVKLVCVLKMSAGSDVKALWLKSLPQNHSHDRQRGAHHHEHQTSKLQRQQFHNAQVRQARL